MKKIFIIVAAIWILASMTVSAKNGNLMSELITDEVYALPRNIKSSYFLTKDVIIGFIRRSSNLYIYLCDVTGKLMFELQVNDVQDSAKIYKTESEILPDNRVLVLITEYKENKDSYDHYIYVIDFKQFKLLSFYQYNEYFAGISEKVDEKFKKKFGSNYNCSVFCINDEIAYLCGVGLWSLDLRTGEAQLVLTSDFAESKENWGIEKIPLQDIGPRFYGIEVIDDQLLFRCYMWDEGMRWKKDTIFNSVLCTIDEKGKVSPVNDKDLKYWIVIRPEGIPLWMIQGVIDDRYIVFRRDMVYDFKERKMYYSDQTLMLSGNSIYAYDKNRKCLSVWNGSGEVKKIQLPFEQEQKVEMYVAPAANANSIFFYTYEEEGDNYFYYSTDKSDWYRYDIPNQKLSLVMPKDENARSYEDIVNMIDSYCGGLLRDSIPHSHIDTENNGDRYELDNGSLYRMHWEYWDK